MTLKKEKRQTFKAKMNIVFDNIKVMIKLYGHA